MQESPLRRRLPAAAAVILFAAAAWLVFSQRDWIHYRRLDKGGRGADGWVTSKSSGPDRLIYYSFKVGSRQFDGVQEADGATPEFDSLGIGDDLVVFYLSADPAVSCVGAPTEHLREQNLVLAWGMLLGIWPAIWLMRRELRRQAGETAAT